MYVNYHQGNMFDESGRLSYGSTTVSFAPWILSVEWHHDVDDFYEDEFPVGYTTADVVYQWTAGRGVNIASDMKLSQVWSLHHFIIISLWSKPAIKWTYPFCSQFDLISSPTGNETTHLNHGLPFSLKMMMITMTRMNNWWWLWSRW